jgi:predicted nuclease of restriction endonuclease-like (RecB) superfamily
VAQIPCGHIRALPDKLDSQEDRDWYARQAVENGRSRDVLRYQIQVERLQDTLLELGRGIAFVGRQVRLTVDGADCWVDLLLFHVEQLRYIAVELKVGVFEPAHIGQLGTWVAMVDGMLRRPEIHAPTVGILLCSGKRESVVRYALASTASPVAVADWTGLPPEARAALPSAEELQAVVSDELALRAAEADRRSSGGAPAGPATPQGGPSGSSA